MFEKILIYYDEYIKILEEHHIENAREKIENMYILDFLIMNEDRHLNNFGVIRDVNTLKWVDIAPIFDSGESLKMIIYDHDEVILNGEGRLFYCVIPSKEYPENRCFKIRWSSRKI